MRIVFAGSPAAAVPSLIALAEADHDIAAVITRTDSRQGRKSVLTPTPVAVAATGLGLPVIRSNRLADETTEAVATIAPDLGVIVAYGGLVREPLLSLPRLGWINLHFSLLPRWRGAAPVQHAIMAGDTVTGATVFRLVPELDAGDILSQKIEPIGALQTAGALLETLAGIGADLLTRTVDDLAHDRATAQQQTGEITLAPKLTAADSQIDWSQPAEAVNNVVRAVTPEPGAFTNINGVVLKILDSAITRDTARLEPGVIELRDRCIVIGTATAPIELITVHPAGRRAMRATDWWRGRPVDREGRTL